jgi:hypothetical protein
VPSHAGDGKHNAGTQYDPRGSTHFGASFRCRLNARFSTTCRFYLAVRLIIEALRRDA